MIIERRARTEDDSDLQLIVTTSASIAANRILCLHFIKFREEDKNNIRKNKGRSKTEKPDRHLAFTT